jgi:hypothetical protein
MGFALAVIPIGVLLAVVLNNDPAPVAAMRSIEVDKVKKAEPKVELQSAPEPTIAEPEKPIEPPEPTRKARRRSPKKVNPKPKVAQNTGPKSSKPRTIDLPMKLPTSALSLTLDEQTLFQGPGVRTVELRNVVPMKYEVECSLGNPDSSGVRDLVAVELGSGRSQVIASLYSEPDRVLFSWSPETRLRLASAFLLAHEFVVQDDTHLTTIQMEFEKPIVFDWLPLPVRTVDVSLPSWFHPDYPCSLLAKFEHADGAVEIGPIEIGERPSDLTEIAQSKPIRTRSLDDPIIKQGRISAVAYYIGSPRRITFSSNLELNQGHTGWFPWSQRKAAIEDGTKKANQGKKKQGLKSANRKKKIEEWGQSLACQLELFVEVNGRKVLWAKSGVRPNGGEEK